jgi:hypothetical protein
MCVENIFFQTRTHLPSSVAYTWQGPQIDFTTHKDLPLRGVHEMNAYCAGHVSPHDSTQELLDRFG